MKATNQFIPALTAVALLGLSTSATRTAQAEVKLGEAGGWEVTTDGQVNAFASHVFGDNRPDSLSNLNWVGFNESTSSGQANANNELRRTRIRSGYTPSTLAFNFRKQLSDSLKVSSRVEVGFQITNINPSDVGDPTWMDPRAVYLDIAGNWGSIRGGRDFSLFARGNLFMNYSLGHAYGLGFPCAYETMFGGACGHVGFGTLWPDFRAQITYTTPSIADIANISVGVFDPRTVPTYQWEQTPMPRIEGEATANISFGEGMGLKLWASAFYQTVGGTADEDIVDPLTLEVIGEEPVDFTRTAMGFAGGAQASFGPIHLGATTHMGEGLGPFVLMTFNPIFVGQDPVLSSEDREFRPTQGFLVQAKGEIGNSWITLGYGQTNLDRIDTDPDILEPDAIPIIRSHTGISVGLFHRINNIVLGLDYFNAAYDFDARVVTDSDTGALLTEDQDQQVNIVNGGVTVEW